MREESIYSQSFFIKYFDSKRTFHYEIIKEGTYPLGKQLCYTKKLKHPIPHDYVVKMLKLNMEKQIMLLNVQLNMWSQNLYLEFVLVQILQVKYNPQNLQQMLLANTISNDDVYSINFGQLDKVEKTKRIEAVVKLLDKGHVSREAYQSIAKIEPNISQNPDIIDNTIVINMLESVGKGGQQRITNILNYIIPFYIKWEILIPEKSTLHIRISGDGRNVEQKIKHVMLTMALLNNINRLQKPDNHYTLVLYPGAETYESLKNVLAPLISDLIILKKKRKSAPTWTLIFQGYQF
ncbi:hypothetical protein RhiirC2_858286 [Rhizophagus irregularis]|uniref:Uncharacterized protein n=1 Tax=Rhizophagus irregularis TaxID=588596 RepID=A0A2N1M6J5_9GLOM|nr:hypothetical protein RhiirC2_858286 [Rhizophagus irregularis]